MKDVVTRLLLAYRREQELYGEVLSLARANAEKARQCRPLEELHAVNERKHTLLEEIEVIERTIARDKRAWCDGGRDADGARDLDRVLAQLTECIGEILRAERETERWIIAGSGLPPALQSTGS